METPSAHKGVLRSVVLTATSVALAVLVGAYVHALRLADAPRPGDPADPAQVATGERLYAVKCAECHGATLQGQPNWRQRKEDGTLPAPPHDASGHTWHHSDQTLFDYTKEGGQPFAPDGFKSAMPAFGSSLSDADIWAVLAFIKSRWPEETRRRQAQRDAPSP